ncbi:MAG: FAD-dependent oxidoreductase [Gemmatimonadota bacterium]
MSGDRSKLSFDASVMTRRQLLQRFGLFGGSSLVLGTMNALDLMATTSRPRPVLEGNANARVIILGAGISGLVAGYELGKLGYDYQILEARDRVGGLAWTVKQGSEHTELGPDGERQVCQFDEGNYINAGPWRIPHSHTSVTGYCKELGVRLEQFVDDNTVMFSENPELGPLANQKVRLREVTSDMWGHTTELLAKAVNQGALDQQLTTEDKERLLEFLVRAGYLDGPDQLYSANEEARGSADVYDLNTLLSTPFVSQVRSVNAGTGGPAPVFQPTGGMMQIPLAFERAIGDRITRGAAVETVRQSDNGVSVVYRNTRTGERQEVTGDYVICCLPMSILKLLDVNFSPEMAAAVEETGHASQAKMGVQAKRRFWEEDDGIYGGHLFYMPYQEGGPGGGRGRNPIPSFSYPSNDFHSASGVLLGFYGNSQTPSILDGRPLVEVPIAHRIEHVVTATSKIHPQMREEFDNAYAVWWDRVEYSRGAWASSGATRDRLAVPDGRIFIGSAALSDHPAWIDGAIHAAWQSIEALHERAVQTTA